MSEVPMQRLPGGGQAGWRTELRVILGLGFVIQGFRFGVQG